MLTESLTPYSDLSTPPTPDHNAHGIHGTIIVLDRNNAEESRFPLSFDKDCTIITFGRHSSCNIVIRLQTVSRQHTQIEYDNGTLYVSPVTTNGPTYLNDEIITEAVELYGNDIITIGGKKFRFEKPEESSLGISLTSKDTTSSEKDATIYTRDISKKLFEINRTSSLDSTNQWKLPLHDTNRMLIKTPPKDDMQKSPSSTVKRKSSIGGRKSNLGGQRKSISFAVQMERVQTFMKDGRTTDIKRDNSPKTPAVKVSRSLLNDDIPPFELQKENEPAPEYFNAPFVLEPYRGEVTLTEGFKLEEYLHDITLSQGFVIEEYHNEVTRAFKKPSPKKNRVTKSPVKIAPSPVKATATVDQPLIQPKRVSDMFSPQKHKSEISSAPKCVEKSVQVSPPHVTRIKSRTEYHKRQKEMQSKSMAIEPKK